MGLKLGIVSNTFVTRTSLAQHLRLLGLLEFFPVQLYSYEFHVRKPSTEIFRIAATKIGEPAPNILFVGDRIDNDIAPALASGMHAALKEAHTNRGKKIPPAALRISPPGRVAGPNRADQRGPSAEHPCISPMSLLPKSGHKISPPAEKPD